ncbi:putative GTPase activating protein complex, subunit Bfa1/Byr4 [Septoria linicola]|nr:putative GTPase activating protein complex, subunit Bfa1/Byr4 [Septoria linicola]
MAVESWDLDDDFQGDFQAFGNTSIGTGPLSMSSRMSTRSESLAGDEDWNVVITPNDEQSTTQAIQSAKQAGIPLPENVPTSALLGGTIKRLGKKKSKQKIDHDWDNDLEMSDQPLQLKARTEDPGVMSDEGFDDFDEDLEGSLGIRFAGKRENRTRSGSASVMSPSLGSATADSEVDDLGGLDFPEGPMDFEAMLKKRRAADAELSDLSQPSSAVIEQEPTMTTHKKSKLESDDNDDFLGDLVLGDGEILNVRKRTTNRNVQVKSTRPPPSAQRPATTLNFHDRTTNKPIYTRSHIPRPVSGTRQTSRLDPVFENGDTHGLRNRRGPTTTSAQLLRSKRSMPVLRNQSSHGSLAKTSVPFLPAGVSNSQSSHVTAHRAMPYHLRRDSDPSRAGAQSPPPPRPSSRLSNQITPDTPSRASRHRENVAPAALVRQAAAKHTLTKPIKKRHFGDGNELEIFDDLPTSVSKESKFVKQPVGRGPPKQSTLRRTQSRSEFTDASKRNSAITVVPDRMMTPAPPRTPASPTKGFHDAPTATPSYLRDTAASRIARETRLAHQPRPRSEGPLQPLTTNWKAQVAARSPFSSPSAQRQKSVRRPGLIAGIGSHVAKSEKGMIYNPQTLRWEGNENTLQEFDITPLETPTPQLRPRSSYIERTHQRSNTSPSRPALISHVPTGSGFNIQVQNGMVYDPQQMKWLKVKGGRDVSGQLSPSATDVEDEEDAFLGIEDLKDENAPAAGRGISGMGSPMSTAAAPAENFHEEFDVGLRFIDLQRTEEDAWRRICSSWFTGDQPRPDDGRWRRSIRDIVPAEGFGSF